MASSSSTTSFSIPEPLDAIGVIAVQSCYAESLLQAVQNQLDDVAGWLGQYKSSHLRDGALASLQHAINLVWVTKDQVRVIDNQGALCEKSFLTFAERHAELAS